ncbi:MAG: hypothetical protein AVDCRST_MAG08-2338, partial [uncultured Acetobacteraceae bacterium]
EPHARGLSTHGVRGGRRRGAHRPARRGGGRDAATPGRARGSLRHGLEPVEQAEALRVERAHDGAAAGGRAAAALRGRGGSRTGLGGAPPACRRCPAPRGRAGSALPAERDRGGADRRAGAAGAASGYTRARM